MKEKFFIIGGDLRQLACAKKLKEKGYDVRLYGFFDIYLKDLPKSDSFTEDLLRADYVLLPLPVTRDGETVNTPLWDGNISLKWLMDTLQDQTVVFGGMIQDSRLLARGNVFDYAKQEDFLIKNAQITAEGALQIVCSETPFSVYGSNVLITGYGRIGKILAKLCVSMGARTYVAARNPKDFAWIELAGCTPVRYDTIIDCLSQADVVLNTVPCRIFGKKQISAMKADCLFVDLASVPGGIDWDAAKQAELKTIWALSLPGKVAPYSSGGIIADTLCNLLEKNSISKE